jgi:Tfp pilus assembly protein PilX
MDKHPRRPTGDTGGAMLIVVLVGLILTGMGIALARTSIANLDNAGRDRVSSSALGIAEAGVAGAVTHLRGSGVKHICSTCTLGWNVATPMTLTYQGGTASARSSRSSRSGRSPSRSASTRRPR